MDSSEPPSDQSQAINLQAPARFAAVSVAAFAIDLVLLFAIRQALGWPLWLAAGASFLIVGAGAYLVHEFWTFRNDNPRASPARLAQTLLASGAALGGRVAVIAALEIALDPRGVLVLACVGVGAATSLCVNFALNIHWVHRAARA
jgi:putative flippase GtrA